MSGGWPILSVLKSAASGPSEATGETVRQTLLAGGRVQLDPASPARDRAVAAEWIEQAVLADKEVSLENAVITGPIRLRYAVVQKEFALINCCFLDRPDFSYAIFKRSLTLVGSVFTRGMSFRAASFEHDADLTNVVVVFKPADFTDLHAVGAFVANRARFGRRAMVSFHRARFEKIAFFRLAVFKGDATFLDVKVEGSAEFQESVFKRGAQFGGLQAEKSLQFSDTVFEKGAAFNSVRVKMNAHFQGARFNGKEKNTRFDDALFEGSASFEGAVFEHLTIFNGSRVFGSLFFRTKPSGEGPATRFEGEANFIGVLVGSNAEFTEAVFMGPALFGGAGIGGRTIFRRTRFLKGSRPSFARTHFKQAVLAEGARFEDEVDFQAARFDALALFHGAEFLCEAGFQASRFGSLAHFGAGSLDQTTLAGAVFHPVKFDHAVFEADARFDQTVFRDTASFRETSFRVARFSENGRVTIGGTEEAQFHGSLDLRGCRYERIQCQWESLLRRADGTSRLEPYDRQPMLQLQRMFRSTGQDSYADEVCLERRCVERRLKFHDGQYGSWVGSWMYKLFANYGVRPYRLMVIPLFLLALGTVLFSLHGAARLKSSEHSFALIAVANAVPEKTVDLGRPDALRLSIRIFLPVEVPLETRAEPSDELAIHSMASSGSHALCLLASLLAWIPIVRSLTFSDLGAVLKIAGWILVPLGIAALSGILRSDGATKSEA
jgi:uncharacterized protein YjbI with pentapeptide repeats